MLNILRQNSALAAIITILLGVLLRVPVYLNAKPYEYIMTAPFSGLLFNFIQTLSNGFLWSYIIATVLIIGQAILLNYIIAKHDVLYKTTFLPGFIFLLFSSIFPEQSQLTPQLLSNTFLLFILTRLFYLYESNKPLFLVLDAGMYLGIGLLFNYDFVLYLPFILVSVIIFTSFNLRYIIVSILGALIPIYFVAVYFFATDKFETFIQILISSLQTLEWSPALYNYYYFIPLAVVGITTLSGAFGLQQNFFKNKVKTRRVLQSLMLLFGFSLFGLFLENNNVVYAFFFCNISLSVATAYYFISKKRAVLKVLTVLFFITISLVFTYLYFGLSVN